MVMSAEQDIKKYNPELLQRFPMTHGNVTFKRDGEKVFMEISKRYSVEGKPDQWTNVRFYSQNRGDVFTIKEACEAFLKDY